VNKAEKADVAFDLYTKIVEAKSAETNRVIYLGHLFKQIRDKKLFKHLDSECGSFNEFLAMPEIGFARSTCYSYIRLFEKYVEELNYDVGYLAEIGHKRLQLILPFVDKDPVEWLSRAKTWSYKDLLNQIRKEKGRQPMPAQKEVQRGINKNYTDYVGEHSCIFHEKRKSEKAHFPRTDKAGGLSSHLLPLCHECHIRELHGIGVDSFLCLYKNQIFDYVFDLIDKLYEELNATK
jgi:hypothetical protein